MAEQGANQANQGAEEGEGQQQQGWMSSIMRMVMMWMFINFVMNKFRGDGNQTEPQTNPDGTLIPLSPFQLPHRPYWNQNTLYDIHIWLSEIEDMNSVIYSKNNDESLVYSKKFVKFSCDDTSYFDFETNITLPIALTDQSSQNENELYYFAHIVLNQNGYPYNPNHTDYNATKVVFRTHPLIEYRKPIKTEIKSLLYENTDNSNHKDSDSGDDDDSDDNDEDALCAHWKPELTLRMLCDWSVYSPGALPPQIDKYFEIDHAFSNDYWPVLYMDDFWLLSDKLIALNSTMNNVKIPLKIMHSPITNWKLIMQTQMETQYSQQQQWGLSKSENNDEVRRLLMESNPILLGVTMVVTLLHTVFDFLAFKNDIQFWHKTKSVKGLSIRTIFVNCFCQIVIFLYLLEQDTTWMILISSFIGLLIEFWKITQAATVTYGLNERTYLPWISVKNKKSYAETAGHDKQAMKYLAYACYPLLFGYTCYSLVYNEHKGWYSFVIGTLVTFIYMFGFIMMCPQLYLNYKLKSTAHLPWRMMSYKFLNTIIDDLFAFLITMPTLHRLSCFRDDIVFLIFLYQKWIYPTDYKRVNEYGFVQKDKDGNAIENGDNDNDDEGDGGDDNDIIDRPIDNGGTSGVTDDDVLDDEPKDAQKKKNE